MITCYDMCEVDSAPVMAFSGCGISLIPDSVKTMVRCDCMCTDQALKWLSSHIWGALRIDHDAEEGIWTCRWAAWPFIRAAGAGRTMDEAVRRCHMMARRNRREAQKHMATEEDLRSI